MENENNQYYVVEILNPPHKDFDKYVCVPDSWMGLRDFETHTAFTKYPIEEISVTEKRVENKEKFSKDWPLFEVNVKFGGDSYDYVKKYVTFLHNISLITKGMEHIDLKIKATETKSKELLVDPNLKEHNSMLEKEQSTTKCIDNNKTIEPTISHDSNLNESTSNLTQKLNYDLLTKLKNMDLSIKSRCKRIKRVLHEHKEQSMVIKTMIKSMENFDATFEKFIADISHSNSILSVNDEKNDDDILVTDNNDQNLELIKDRGEKQDSNDKSRTGNVVVKKRTLSDSDSNNDRPKQNLENHQEIKKTFKSPDSNVKTNQATIRKNKTKDSFYRNMY